MPSAVLSPEWLDAASADLQTGCTVRLDKEMGKKQSVLPWRCFTVFDHSERKSFRDAGNPEDSYCNTWVIPGVMRSEQEQSSFALISELTQGRRCS